MEGQETPLSGGNVKGVVRIGNTVHRAMGPWSPSIKELLDTVVLCLEALCNLLIHRSDVAAYQKMIAEGHLDHYRREIIAFQHVRNQLELNLLP